MNLAYALEAMMTTGTLMVLCYANGYSAQTATAKSGCMKTVLLEKIAV